MLILSLNIPIDLDLSMYPSFASVLFRRSGRNEWIKVFGYGKGTKIHVSNNKLVCEGTVCKEVINEWAGLWFNPMNYVNEISSKVGNEITSLISCFNDLRIIVSSYDKEVILLATFLSRRTDYHRNVIRWMHKILTISEDPLKLSREKIISVGKSYQLKQLSKIIYTLIETLRKYSEGNPWKLRYELLKIKYVGPKVADTFMLFAGYGTYFTASDVHYINFLKLLNIEKITQRRLVIPNKSLCLRHGAKCFNCPYNKKCVSGLSIELFGRLSGYIQTLAYVIDKALRGPYHVITDKVYYCLRKSKIIGRSGFRSIPYFQLF